MKLNQLCIMILWSVLAVGCASRQLPESVAQAYLPALQQLQVSQQLDWAEPGDTGNLEFADPAQAQQWALQHAVTFVELLSRLQVEDARLWQQSLLSNPGFEVSFREPADGGRWQLEAGFTLGLADWLSRSRRMQVASSEHVLWQLQALSSVNDYLSLVRRQWLDLVAARQRLAIHQTLHESASLARDLATLMRQAGTLNEFDLLVFESGQAEQALHLRQAEQLVQSRLAALRTTLGVPAHVLISTPAELPDYRVANTLDPLLHSDSETDGAVLSQSLLQQAVANYPGLRQLDELLQRQQQRLGLTRQQIALMQSGVEISSERESDGRWLPGIGVRVGPPLFDRGDARQAAIMAETQVLMASHQQTLSQIHNRIELALATRSLSQDSLEQLRQYDLPRYNRLQALALQEYNFMLRGGFDLLQLRQQTLTTQIAYVDTLLQWWLASAELANALGAELTLEDTHHD